ncbi:dihydrofolate reductase family protein [Bizionia paragorgiae]|uniref:dihydrofolate reductase family protein n=1 Tax=Bizionia paragorgiae TaxID=283786 RepID=UPI003A903F9E
MRNVVLDLAVTLDGYIEGPNGEIDWCIMEDDMDFNGFLDTIDTILYGRISYDLWGNFQPQPESNKTELELWRNFHSKKKYVFSKHDRKESKAILINSDIETEVKKLNQVLSN